TTTYYVEITDGINWCTDSVTVNVEQAIGLEINAFLEGPFFIDEMTPLLNLYDEIPITQPYNTEPWNYEGSESVTDIPSFQVIDWVLVELLAPTAETLTFESIAKRAGFVLMDGSIKDIDGVSNLIFNDVIPEEFYIRIYHRNHLSITSSVPVTESNGAWPYDFTTDASKVLGDIHSHKEINSDLGIWGMMAGDGDANGQIDNQDKNDIWHEQRNTYGYLSGDFDMNRQVSDVDINSYWIFNAGQGMPEDSVANEPPSFICGDPLIDTRDGQSYNTVQIGDQCWMAENLNIGTRIDGVNNMTDDGNIEKYCYDNLEANCDTYGGLYQWNEMMEYVTTEGVQGICPTGWHLPSDAEWGALITYVGGVSVAGGELKSTKTAPDTHPRWDSPNTGATNSSGFTAIPGGNRTYYATFPNNLGLNSLWWSSTQYGTGHAWAHILAYNSTTAIHTYSDKGNGMTVRCLNDEPVNQAPSQPSSPSPTDASTGQ
ncbi:MAG: hypothetical protein DRJ05_11770, partial [Bacteroidetes bacterium]